MCISRKILDVETKNRISHHLYRPSYDTQIHSRRLLADTHGYIGKTISARPLLQEGKDAFSDNLNGTFVENSFLCSDRNV